jgi:hypothetical protein
VIIRNAVQCVYCGHVLESKHRHDYRTHECKDGPVLGKKKKWNTEMTELEEIDEPQYPWIMVDGGLEYLRRGGEREHYIELSEYK